ncbi:50S ribosomal protein L25/general stress protein Ctc [Azospirillum doebereinerae]|uniref:Large ribosomal subunit protein bL25 n=1 Tax=Azospirillum doebereinerae TaxID=92933 RepID=A0A3S0V7G5_9PROT|nr:50S ribosomal protein L25/general stress protein Ctc [Azospirillum doebereinerae]MCG5239650.1 50S ribosomal protein L25/general stress protein Ctc [Azospirillum doebereinerae]RUQ74115.1 50S ribosomal protein L25/general stress protein Ctc [Azospirillum doebereinerae]
MTKIIPLGAEGRERAGKGTARQTRRDGRIPAVIYGGKQAPVTISLEKFEFTRVLHQPGFFTHLFDVTVDGAAHRVLPRDVQFHPVTDVPLHVDFLRVSSDTRVVVHVPVEFVSQDKSPGLKRGAVLNIVRHELDLECPADNIPEHVTISCEGYDVGDSIHISAVNLPEGVTSVITDRDFTIATIIAPSGLKSEGGEAA